MHSEYHNMNYGMRVEYKITRRRSCSSSTHFQCFYPRAYIPTYMCVCGVWESEWVSSVTSRPTVKPRVSNIHTCTINTAYKKLKKKKNVYHRYYLTAASASVHHVPRARTPSNHIRNESLNDQSQIDIWIKSTLFHCSRVFRRSPMVQWSLVSECLLSRLAGLHSGLSWML